jgi:peptide/nickel transport system substrate-binding protein
LAAAILLVGCAGPAGPRQPEASGEQAPGTPKRINVAIRGEAKTISAKLNSSAGAGGTPGVSEVEEILNAGLAATDDNSVLRPQLAEAVPTVENGLWKVFPDGRMEVTWRLRPGILWHDGTPFSSADLLFTDRVERDADLPIFRRVASEHIEGVETPDPRTVTVKWKRPFIDADNMFGSPMPRHILEKTYLEDKENLTVHPYWNREFIGTGPFKLKDWVIGSHLVLEGNEKYVLGPPRLDEIVVKFIPDPGTMAANILAGEVDLTLGGRLSLEWGVNIRDQWRDGRMVLGTPSSMISSYPQFINPNPPIQLEPNFRRALLHAVDRQEMIDSLVFGLAPLGQSIISPRDNEYRDIEKDIARYSYDPRRAAQLIEGLGYSKGADGAYSDASGQVLAVTTQTQATDDQQVKSQLSIASYWQQLGLRVEQVTFPQQRAQDREFRATRPAFEVTRQPGGTTNLVRFYGPNTPLPENNFTGVNRTRHRNAEFDGWIDRFFTTIPRGERMELLSRIVRYMTDQVVILPMFYDVGPTMVSNRLYNTEGDTWNAQEWDTR